MHYFTSIIILALVALFTMVGIMPSTAHAIQDRRPVLTANDRPLVIVRFNQDKVFYQRSLHQAVKHALDANPMMTFHVVAFIPDIPDVDPDALRAESGQLASDILNTLRHAGLPESRINLSQVPSPYVGTHEMHIFVR